MVPKTTQPLTKFIRTGEGVLVFAFNIALLVVPIVSNALTAAQSAKWATIIDGVTVISRTGLKMLAQAQPRAGVGTSTQIQPAAVNAVATAGVEAGATLVGAALPAALAPAALATDVADITALVGDAEEFADAPPAGDAGPKAPTVAPNHHLAGRRSGLLGSGTHATRPQPFQVRAGE